MRSRKRLRHKRQGGTEERIPVRRLNAYLWPLRSGATWGNGGLHSGYRHLADKDEAGGSSPPRPTTPLTSRNAGRLVRRPSERGVFGIKTSYLVTASDHGPVQHCSPETRIPGC